MRKNNRFILILALIRFIIPYFLQNEVYEPHRDEFLYLAEGLHLSWGYLEVPPLLSFLAWINHIFGNSIFWIKFWPDLFGSLTFILCAKIATRLGGKELSVWLLFFVFVFTGWQRMFFLFMPNAPEIFFSTWMCYEIFRYVQKPTPKYLYLFGIAVGLGMLTKYTIAFWLLSILCGLAMTNQRKVFKDKHFYFGIILAFLIFLPNLLWQVTHHFPVIAHMKELKESQLEYISPQDFLKGEFMMYLPVFFIWVAGIWFCFSSVGKAYRLFVIAFLTFQLLMLLLHGKSYYTAGSFTILFALGAYYLNSLKIIRPLKFAIVLFPVITGLSIVPLLLPVAKPAALAKYYQKVGADKMGLLNWEDLKIHPLPQDFADMLGWKEMAMKTANAYKTLSSEEKKNCIIWCDNYGEAGALNFYRKQYSIPSAFSDNASFLVWLPLENFPDNVILVTRNKEYKNDPYISQFANITLSGSITNPYAREYGTLILVLKNPTDNFKRIFHEKLDSLRKQFRISE